MIASGPGGRRGKPFLFLGASLWLLFVAVNPGRNEMTDARARLEVAREIWTEGRISLDPTGVSRRAFWVPVRGGRVVSFYGLGQSLAFIPFDIAGCALASAAGSPPDVREFVRWLPVGFGLLPLLGVLWWALIRSILQEAGVARGSSAVLAAIALVATIGFYYVANEQEESLVACLVASSFLFALRWKRSGKAVEATAAGFFGGLAFLTRFDSVFGLLPVAFVFAGGAFRGGPLKVWLRSAVPAAAAFAVPACVALLYNNARFGSFFETGYGRAGLSGLWRIDSRCPKTMLALLLGPGKGWFVLSPLLLVALAGAPELFRRIRLEAWGALLGFAGAVAFYSAFQGNSDGPWSWGTRYLAYFMTFWAIPLALALESWWQRPVRRRMVLLLSVLSGVIQVASVFITQNLEYVQQRSEGSRDWSLLVRSARGGQLARRVSNLARWATHPSGETEVVPPPNEWMPPGSDREKAAFIEARYIPNFWGPSFAKVLHGGARSAALASWGGCLAGSFGLLLLAAARFRRDPT